MSFSPFRAAGPFFVLLLLVHRGYAQVEPSQAQGRTWDLSVWVAGGNPARNTSTLLSLTEAQILMAGFFLGKVLTGEIGSGWRRGRFEYGSRRHPTFSAISARGNPRRRL